MLDGIESGAAGRRRGAGALVSDLALLALLAGAFCGVGAVAREWAGPPSAGAAPDDALEPARLPLCALYSFARGVCAYVLSLAFAVAFGKLAASSPRREKLLLPALDVLQSVPVLSFLPGIVAALSGAFAGSRIGLELAAVLAIFTGQAWNLAFSFHGSLKTVPREMDEAARVFGFGALRRFWSLELPVAAHGLVWNSMMSMAGGWFFLTVVESFAYDGRRYVLPGLGSYLAAAVDAGDRSQIAWAAVAMTAMIAAADQLLWRPALVAAERFRADDAAGDARPPTSWLYELVRRSRVAAGARRAARATAEAVAAAARAFDVRAARASAAAPRRVAAAAMRSAPRALAAGAAVAAAALTVLGGFVLARLLLAVDARSWLELARAIGLTGLRVAAALAASLLWTVPVGVALGRSPRAARLLQPVLQTAASFPAPMLYPLAVPFLLRVGLPSDFVAAGLLSLGAAWYVLFNVVSGTAGASRDLREVASALRLPFARRLAYVDLAAAAPAAVVGLVTGAGGAWNASVVAEAVAYPGGAFEVDGIGSWLARAFAAGDRARLAAGTFALAAALVAINRLAWKPLQRYAATRFAPA